MTGGYILSYINIVYKHRNISVQVKGDCRLLIKAAVFIHHLDVRKFCSMVCTIRGKYSHFYINQEQSILCAVMQLMTAVGHRHVRPTLTNTRLVNLTIEHDDGCPSGPVTEKVVLLPMEPTIGGGCLLFRLALLLSTLSFQARRHSLTLQFRAELHFDHQTVADWSRFSCKAMSNLILICFYSLF